MGYNSATAIHVLESRFVPPFGEQKCAVHVREALQAAGIHLANYPGEAKDYGPCLQLAGFVDIGRIEVGWQKGDVVVFRTFSTHVHGHIAIYDGMHWLSDFRQPSIYSKKDYNNPAASFNVYRL